MQRVPRLLLALFLLLVIVVPAAPASAQITDPFPGCQNGVFADTGASWVICMPASIGEEWNGDLIVFAHGYVSPYPERSPVIPPDQYFLPDGTPMSVLARSLNYAFATTSYRTNGLAIKDGVEDLVQLVDFFSGLTGVSPHTYLFGASEGGLITAKAIEGRPDRFEGGVAACGPIGDFRQQINYMGDFRVVFDHFFPHYLKGGAINIPKKVMYDWWDQQLQQPIATALLSDPAAAGQLFSVTGAAFDPFDPSSMVETTIRVLNYSAMATNDARDKLRGNPFDNSTRIYAGSFDDEALNLEVQRFEAKPVALENIDLFYQTTGTLTKPLVTLHNLLDPEVPYWHETLYAAKVNSTALYIPIQSVVPYGHCSFTVEEVMLALSLVGVTVPTP
jgi:pimeloyl-ACP methyl ester carboxylesterase